MYFLDSVVGIAQFGGGEIQRGAKLKISIIHNYPSVFAPKIGFFGDAGTLGS